jgi:hypothetical protein
VYLISPGPFSLQGRAHGGGDFQELPAVDDWHDVLPVSDRDDRCVGTLAPIAGWGACRKYRWGAEALARFSLRALQTCGQRRGTARGVRCCG